MFFKFRLHFLFLFFLLFLFPMGADAAVLNGGWYNMSGQKISTAVSGQKVQLRALLPADTPPGTIVTFEVWENDTFPFPDEGPIATFQGTLINGDVVFVSWDVVYAPGNNEFLNPDAELYFKAITPDGAVFSSLNSSSAVFGEITVPKPEGGAGGVNPSFNYARWSPVGGFNVKTTASEGEKVDLIASVSNGEGSDVIFTVYENDPLSDDVISITPLVAKVVNGFAKATWTVYYDQANDDCSGNCPPYPNLQYLFFAEIPGSDNVWSQDMIVTPPKNDTTPPTTPSQISADAISSSQIDIAWGGSTDPVVVDQLNSGVSGYELYRNGSLVKVFASSQRFYSDTGLSGATNYEYTLIAVDGAGNKSAPAVFGASTLLNPDSTPPSAPSGINLTPISSSKIDISWGASIDPKVLSETSSGVKEYRVFRDGKLIATVPFSELSYSDFGLSGSTTYNYEVVAYDFAGNASIPKKGSASTFALPVINSVSWSTLNATGGDVVTLTANVSNADGQVIVFSIYEDDGAFGREFGYEVSANVSSGVASADWNVVYDYNKFKAKELTDNLEFVFSANVQNTDITKWELNKLIVSPPADTIPPKISLSSSLASDVNSVTSPVDIVANVSDNDAIDYVEFFIDGISFSKDSVYPFEITSWSPESSMVGKNVTFKAVVYDVSGNSAYDSLTLNIGSSDVTAPSVSIISPQNGANINSSPLLISVDASDPYSGSVSGIDYVEFFVDDVLVGIDSESPYSYSWNAPLSSESKYNIKVAAYDFSGNSASDSIVVSIIPPSSTIGENTAPSPQIDLDAPSIPKNLTSTAISDTEVELRWDASKDNSGVVGYKVYRDGGNQFIADVKTTYFKDAGLLPNTTYTYTVTAYDANDNESQKSSIAIVDTLPTPDTTPPIISLTSPKADSIVSGMVKISADVSDDVSVDVVRFYIDGSIIFEDTIAPFEANWDTSSLTNGKIYNIYAEAQDPSGNIGSSNNISVMIGADAPTKSVSGIIPIYYATKQSESQIGEVQFFVGDSSAPFAVDSAYPYQASLDTTTLTNGQVYTVKVKVFDKSDPPKLLTESSLLNIKVKN